MLNLNNFPVQGNHLGLNPFSFNSDPFGTCEKWWNGNAWLNPDMYTCSVTKRKEYSPRKIIQNKWTKEWSAKERDDGRTIKIGTFSIEEYSIINPSSETKFGGIHSVVNYNGQKHIVVIPEKEFKERNILPYLSFFERNPDCPDKYLVAAFYLAIQGAETKKLLLTPVRSGFTEVENGELYFGCNKSIYPGLAEYYPVDVRERQLISTTQSVYDIAKKYAEALPKIWQYKLLVAIRIASLLLYFTAKSGIVPDQLFVVEPGSESAAKTAISLLKNQNYSSYGSISLTATKTELKEYLSKINDGMALISDNSYVEDWKKRDNGIGLLVDDLFNTNGIENTTRHLITILSGNPGSLPPEIPAMHINAAGVICKGDPDILQKLSGEFDSAFISWILNDPVNSLAEINNIIKRNRIGQHIVHSSENCNIKCLVRISLEIMKKYKLVSLEECKAILDWLKNGYEVARDSSASIVNDFRDVLNSMLFKTFNVSPKYGTPHYVPGSAGVFVDDQYINFEVGVWKRILLRMKTTQKRLKVITALKECGLLHFNNGYKRNVEVEVAQGDMQIVSIYSVSRRILNSTNRELISELKSADFLCNNTEAKIADLHTMVRNKSETKLSGQVFNQDTNLHQYVVGISRSGKSKYLTEQAVETAFHGEKVVIFDNNASFTKQELEKHLPPDLVEKHFSFWNVVKQGLPVNLCDLSNCDTLPEKKQRLKSVYTAGARALGSTQEKVLYNKIGTMIKEREDDVDILNILEYFVKDSENLTLLSNEFENDQNEALLTPRTTFNEKMEDKGIGTILDYLDKQNNVEKALHDKFDGIFQDLKKLPKSTATWAEFLAMQKNIVVISTGSDGLVKGSNLIDMLLASLYGFKQYSPANRVTVILDECQDLYLDTNGPVDIMLRKGGKHGIRMLLASQEFSALKDKLGKIIGNCGTLVFFRPKADNLADIAKLTGVDKTVLANLEQGQCVVYGYLYNKSVGKNKQFTLIGYTYEHEAL